MSTYTHRSERRVSVETTKRLYTIAEVQNILGVSRATVYNLIERGDLKRVKIGKAARIARSSVEEYLRCLESESVDAEE
jgi:excisionase family DNA binding protein